jgi:hypothetical protein
VRRCILTAVVLAVAFLASSAPAAISRTSTSLGARPSRPDHADWIKIKTAAGLRTLALAPHRTPRFRAFAAFLGLTQLASIHPPGPGRCLIAVTYLYNNLRDLENAYPGENWDPLRSIVAKEPSIRACAPRRSRRSTPPGASFTPTAP